MENPIHAGAMGKVLLAFAEPAERAEILDQALLVAVTPATITDRAVLERELDAVRARGYAVSQGERAAGVAGISAPVFDGDHRVVASLSILGPEDRMTDDVRASFVAPLLAAAASVSERIGAFGVDPTDWDDDTEE
jgi:DNA-binding IclR family transcriptional regulator